MASYESLGYDGQFRLTQQAVYDAAFTATIPLAEQMMAEIWAYFDATYPG